MTLSERDTRSAARKRLLPAIPHESTMMIKPLLTLILLGLTTLSVSTPLVAAEYGIDTKDMHAAIQFRIKHLGYSWLTGRFNDFEGRFRYEPQNPEESFVEVSVNTASIDSLSKIPGLSPKIGEAIGAYRDANGAFKSLSDLVNVDGIDAALLDKIKPFLSI